MFSFEQNFTAFSPTENHREVSQKPGCGRQRGRGYPDVCGGRRQNNRQFPQKRRMHHQLDPNLLQAAQRRRKGRKFAVE